MTSDNAIKHEKSYFIEYLQFLNGPKVFFEPLKGNNGDYLIQLGAEHAIRKSGCVIVEQPENADYIIINGGGYFNDIWGGGLKTINHYRISYPEVPIIMAPQTYLFSENILLEFKRICALNDTEIVLFAREAISYEALCKTSFPGNVTCHEGRDLAFELHDSAFLKEHLAKVGENHILFSMRQDYESMSAVIKLVSNIMESPISKANIIKKILFRLRKFLTSMVWSSKCNNILRSEYGDAKCHIIREDASRFRSFEDFCSLIENAAFIITDRLHVAIFCYLLSKRVVLVSNPSYFKVKAVYYFSMSNDGSTVSLIE